MANQQKQSGKTQASQDINTTSRSQGDLDNRQGMGQNQSTGQSDTTRQQSSVNSTANQRSR